MKMTAIYHVTAIRLTSKYSKAFVEMTESFRLQKKKHHVPPLKWLALTVTLGTNPREQQLSPFGPRTTYTLGKMGEPKGLSSVGYIY